MINIPTNVKPGIDLGSLNHASVQRRVPTGSRPVLSGDQQTVKQPARQPTVRVPVNNPSGPRPTASSQSAARPPVSRPAAAGIPSHQGIGAVLQKGQKTSLSALNPNLKMVDVCLGWDIGGKPQYDLDTECFLLGENGKVVGDDWFVFYNQPVSPDRSVQHNGTNKTGNGDGDDEILHVNLGQLSPQVNRLVFILTINEAREQGLNFSGIRNAYIRVVDKQSNKELVRFLIAEYYHSITSMVVGEIYRYKGEWKFTPIGEGTHDDLYGLCIRYGVETEE